MSNFPCTTTGIFDCELLTTGIYYLGSLFDVSSPFLFQFFAAIFFSLYFSKKSLINFFVFYSFAFYSLLEVYIVQSLAVCLALYWRNPLLSFFTHFYTAAALVSKKYLWLFSSLIILSFLFPVLPLYLDFNVLDVGEINILIKYIFDYNLMYGVSEIIFAPILLLKVLILIPFLSRQAIFGLFVLAIGAMSINTIFARFFSIFFFYFLADSDFDKRKVLAALLMVVGFSSELNQLLKDVDDFNPL